jgi:hypothetical protein
MKTIIAGSRTVSDYQTFQDAMQKSGVKITVVIRGGAKGVVLWPNEPRMLGKKNAVPLPRYPAEWKRYGRRAGQIRNRLMAENAEALIAIWDGKRRGM